MTARTAARWALLAGFVFVVVISAGGTPDRDTLLGTGGLSIVPTIVQAVMLVLVVVGVVALVLLGERGGAPKQRQRRSLLSYLAGAALVALVFYALDNYDPEPVVPLQDAPPPAAGGGTADEEPIAAVPEAAGDLWVVLLIAAVIAALGFGWYLRERWSDAAATHAMPAGHAFDAAVARARRSLVDDGDPRTAILNAYAELEQVLEDEALPRTEYETTGEHLRRALAELGVDDRPFRTLGALYERARYSTESLTAADRETALASLAGADGLIPS